MEKIDIAIVGAGPAGLSCAIELSKSGYENVVVFEREEEAGGTPRHCGHQGFGIFEFKRVLTGPEYAQKLAQTAENKGVDIRLKHTLINIDNNMLTFSTPWGLKKVQALKTVFALGAREKPRPSRLISGIRSPNIITTGSLQRFVYMHSSIPFKKAVIVGSEIVSFSALMTCKYAGIEVEAIIEENDSIDSFEIMKPISEYIFKTPVKTGCKDIKIEGHNKHIESIRINDKEKINCEGVIFSGGFTPESAILKSNLADFNHINNSPFITQNYQIVENRDFFIAGNVVRGALTAFNCFFEGKKVAKYVDLSFRKEGDQNSLIKIKADENVLWYYPSVIDVNKPSEYLTKLRIKKNSKGVIKVFVNSMEFLRKEVNAKTYLTITIPTLNRELYPKDEVEIKFFPN